MHRGAPDQASWLAFSKTAPVLLGLGLMMTLASASSGAHSRQGARVGERRGQGSRGKADIISIDRHRMLPIGSLHLRGGAAAAAVHGIARFYPWSYPSIPSWIFALFKIATNTLLSKFGFGPLFKASAGGGEQAAVAKGDSMGCVVKMKERGPATDEELKLKAKAEKLIQGTAFKDELFDALRGKPVTLVTNSAIFSEEELQRSGDDAEKKPPTIIQGALASLLKLASVADLYLITQFAHSGHMELSKYFEAHTVASDASVHGVWQDDKQELAVRKALEDAGVFAAGMNPDKVAFCETIDGRGYLARNIGEELTSQGRIFLHVDDAPLSVEWLQNVCRNTTVVAIKTEVNKGDFAVPKNTEPPVVVGSIAEYFEKKD